MPGTVRIGLLDRFQAVKAGGLICPLGIHEKPGAARESVGLQGGPVGACQVGTGFDDDDLVAGAG